MTNKRVIRKTYFTRNVGDYPEEFEFFGSGDGT